MTMMQHSCAVAGSVCFVLGRQWRQAFTFWRDKEWGRVNDIRFHSLFAIYVNDESIFLPLLCFYCFCCCCYWCRILLLLLSLLSWDGTKIVKQRPGTEGNLWEAVFVIERALAFPWGWNGLIINQREGHMTWAQFGKIDFPKGSNWIFKLLPYYSI